MAPLSELALQVLPSFLHSSMWLRVLNIANRVGSDTRLTLSPIRGADLFQDSIASADLEAYDLQQLYQARASAASQRLSIGTPKTPYELTALKPMTPSPPRPSTSDFVMKEYFAIRTAQQELFDLENFSLHSAEDVSGFHELSLER
jgi:hypothetical protein